MDDSHPERGTPVLSDPWVKAHTPTMDGVPSMDPRKKRRSWFTGSTPLKSTAAPDTKERLPEHKEEEVATLQITHFTKKVMLSFDDVRLGSSRTLTLRLENPHDFPQEVELERFPFQKGFSVPDTVWEIDGSRSLDVPVSWTPTEEKNVRELVTFKCEGSFRLQLIILGTVKVPKKKKNINRRSTFTARKGQAIQSRQSIAVTNPRRETFVQKKRSPRSKPYPDVGKENEPLVGAKRKIETPRTRKARARSVGTVLEKILTPRKVLPQGEVERVMVGDKVCTFSPQLTAKAMMEITGESPFADGKIQTEPRKETLTLCDGMSPLLQTTGKQDLRKVALENEVGPLRRLSKEQMSTVTKSTSPESRLSDENGMKPHCLEFLEPDESEISKILATPASSVFEPMGQSIGTRLSSTRIDDSVYSAPVTAPFFLAQEDESPSSMEDDSLDRSKLQVFDILTDDKPEQNDDLHPTDDVQECGDENETETCEPRSQDVENLIVQDAGAEEETEPCDTIFKSDLHTLEDTDLSDKFSNLPEPLAEEESLYPSDQKDGQSLSSPVPEAIQKGQSWRISLGGSGPATSPKEAPVVQKPKPQQEASSWRVSLGSSKRSPGARPVAQKRPVSRVASRTSTKTSAPPSKPSPLPKTNEDFTIHRSAVTGTLKRNGKRLSDPTLEPAVVKKIRPSPEHKASTTRETLRSKNAAANKSRTCLSTSRQVNRTVALRKAAATGKALPAAAPASAKPKGKPKAPRAVKGVPMAKLQLVKPSRSALPRHPLPFAAKNIFYDERWMEKQDRAFTCWLNYILTPDIDTPKDPNKNIKIDAHLLCLEGTSKTGPAPTKEDLSLRAYTARRRLNRLRRGACLVFQSEPVIRVMQKLEAEVEKGRIVVRSDKMLHADLGIKQELLNLILCYNPLWLRIGLETIYGELLPIQDNSDVYGMSRFVVTRLLGNPDIAAVHAHPTVPNLFGPGYQAALAQFTLKKFLMLVFFLDRAKLTRLIDHDPCLFCKEAQVKSSRDLLLEFSRRYLKGEGDITRHLSFLGYSVTHVQRPLDEFDFAVTKLAVDLRCGVRLSRVVELLTQNWSLSKELRVPAISRLQKIHNVEVAFKVLKERGIDVDGGGLNTRVIVDGHREKTLELLWRIIFHYQVGVMLNEEHIREEIAFLTKNRKLKEKISALKKGGNNGPSNLSLDGVPHLYFKSPQLMLLMDWCKAVCSFYDLQIENFTVSFCDGRALCLLVHHYHPSLLPYESINQDTTLMQFQREEREDLDTSRDSFDGTWSHTFSPSTGKETDQEKLLCNERQNFKLLYEKVNELGGVPMMVRSADMSNTIPDEKVVITYVSYLCARLLDLRQETRAARTIQLAWRAHHLRKEQKMRVVRENAANKIQSAVRTFLLKRHHERIGGAVLTIQTAIRGYLAKQRVRRLQQERKLKKKIKAAILIQAAMKGFLVRQSISRQHTAATLIQSTVRGHMTRMSLTKMNHAASRVQGWYRSQRDMKTTRQRFLQLKRASVRLQSVWRGILVQRLVAKMKAAAIVLQMYYRRHRAVNDFRMLKEAVLKMQALYRSKVIGEAQRVKYQALRDGCIVFQKVYRGRLARKVASRVKSAVIIQAAFRGRQQRVSYMKLRSSVVLIQALVRGAHDRRQYLLLRQSAMVLQTRYRAVLLGRKGCREYNVQRGAAIIIQSAVRCYQQRQLFLQTKKRVILVQAAVKRYLAQKRYRQLQGATVVMQTRYRAVLLGRRLRKDYCIAKGAAITMQAAWKGYSAKRDFLKQKSAAVKIQAVVRCHLVRHRYIQLQKATVTVQRQYRAVLQTRQAVLDYCYTRGAVITLQAAVRGYLKQKEYQRTRAAIITLQTSTRCYLARKDFTKKKSATIVLQRRFRALVKGREQQLEYQQLKAAAVTLQAGYRCHVQRVSYIKQRFAAIAIQAEIRQMLARKQYLQLRKAAIVLQTRFRARILMQQLTQDYAVKRNSAILIQSTYRGHVQRKIFLRQKSAAVVLQARVRGYLQHQHYVKMQRAVLIIQMYFRSWKIGQACMEEFYLARGRIITIQALYRGCATRKMLNTQKAAATTIQANFRCYVARTRYSNLKQAVCILQRRLRAQVHAREARESFQKTRAGIVAIQSLYRGYILRKELARQHQAATAIQSSYKRYIARSRYLHLQRATLILQTRYRSLQLGRAVCRDYNVKRGAVITLQAAYRGYSQRMVLSKQRHAAIVIQATVRGHQASKSYTSLRNAAILVQRLFRANMLRKRICMEYNVMRGAAITLQAAYRGHLQRRSLVRQNLAATQIQTRFRGFITRRWYSAVCKAVQVLQTRYRALKLTRSIQKEYLMMKGAAITLQAAYRGHLHRKALAEKHVAATKIQAAFRGFITQRWYLTVCKAVQILQTRFRAQKLAQLVQKEYQTTKKAAVTLQAAHRGHLQRKALAEKHVAATKIQAAFRGFITRKWYGTVCRAVVVLQTRFRAFKVGQEMKKDYKDMKEAAITLQAAYRGMCQRKILAQQHFAASKIQATFRGFVARKRYLNLRHATMIFQKRFRALKLGREIQREYRIKVGALITLQAAVRGHAARRALQRQHEMATRIQACFKGYVQRIRFQKMAAAALVLQRHFRAYHLGKSIRGEYNLKRSSAIKIQAFYRCHRERKSFVSKKQFAVRIQARVRGYLGRVQAKKFRQERTIAAITIQRQWRANALRDQQMRCYNIQRGAAITIQAAARTYLVRQSLKKQHRAATCIQSAFKCHQAVQSYRKTLKAIHVLQVQWRACLLARKVQEEYVNCKKAAVTLQAVYRGLRVRRRIALEHAAATKIEAMVRQFITRKQYVNQKKAAIVLQRRFRATKSCQVEVVKYHLTRGACITLQACVRGFLARRALAKSHRAATLIQSAYRSFKQQQRYKQTMKMVKYLQTKIRAYLEGKKVHREYNAMKSAAVTLQSVYRGLGARRLAARHRAARCIQSVVRMHLSRKIYVTKCCSAIKIQAFIRMHLARKYYSKVYGAVCIIQKYSRGYLETKKARGDYLMMKSSAIIIQSHLRRLMAERHYQKQRQAAVCIQSHYRQMVQHRRYQAIRTAVIVLQKRYRANVLARETMHEYHMARGAAITLQAVFRGYLQCCRYRNLRCHVICMQARARGTMARRRFVHMVREKEAAICIQRHVRGYRARKTMEAQRKVRLSELQAFADRTKAHLSVIRLQRAFRNFRLRRAFQQKMDAIITIQRWMRAKLLRLRYRKVQGATLVLQRGARRYLVRKNTAATKLQSVARVWLAKRQVQKMQSAALKMQALWRGHRVRRSIKSKKVNAARARCQRANRNVTEEKKLCNRTASALDYLLHYKSMHRILETLMNLEVVSRLSATCCQRLVEGGAVPVLYVLIRGCNRSVPCMEMIEIIISILLNIAKHDSTQHAVLDAEESVTTLLDLLQIYREKNALIFCKTCVILGRLLQDTTQAKIILSCPKTKEKIASLHKLTSRKHAMDERRIKTKTLNASSSFLGTSFNTSSMSASFAAGTPRKRRKVLTASSMEWNIADPMRAIDFLKRMADRV